MEGNMVDEAKFQTAFDQLWCELASKQANEGPITFHGDSIVANQEGYKYKVYAQAHEAIVKADLNDDDAVMSAVLEAFSYADNLVYY